MCYVKKKNDYIFNSFLDEKVTLTKWQRLYA